MKHIHVIIASLPGTWQRLLQNDIGSQPFVQVVAVASGSLSAVQLVEEHQPDLLLIDASIHNEDAIAIINTIKREKHSVLIVAIADTYQQQRSMTKAGANFVVSTYEFKTQIQEILNQLNEMCTDAIDCDEQALDVNK